MYIYICILVATANVAKVVENVLRNKTESGWGPNAVFRYVERCLYMYMSIYIYIYMFTCQYVYMYTCKCAYMSKCSV
jgi:hypothetical protein